MKTGFIMDIPAMQVPGAEAAQTFMKGGGSYVTTFDNTEKKDYLQYLEEVSSCGFTPYAQVEEGIGGTVFNTTFTRDALVVSVTYYDLEKKTSVSFYEGPVSKHLVYDVSYVAGNIPGKKTRLHMNELFRFGNSFIFELKNGHFLLSDGGIGTDLPYLLDYLETLAPKGEKPVVEGWIISHGHGDHCGALMGLSDHPEWAERIIVDGVYYSEPSDEVCIKCDAGLLDVARMKWSTKMLKTQTGERTRFYRPQTGQRYYFCDITMDVILSQEQVPFEEFGGDINTASTVCVFTCEGQKSFFSGDIHQEGLAFIMRNYTREYMVLDFFTLNHHGFNTSLSFAEFATYKTIFVTINEKLPIRMMREGKYLLSKAQEYFYWGSGTKIVTFPYTIGTYETVPPKKWVYNVGEERLPQPNLYTFPGRRFAGFIFQLPALFDGALLKKGMKEFLDFLRERNVQMSVFAICPECEIKARLEAAGILDYFRLLLGTELLDPENPYLDAAWRSEACFQLDHVHKYVVVCDSMDVVLPVIADGLRTLLIKPEEEVTPEMKLKCWHIVSEITEMYDFFLQKKAKFE